VDKQENHHVLDLPRIIAVGVASPAGATLTSRFGVAGTLVGLALSAVLIAVVSDLLNVYLHRLLGAFTTIAGQSRKKGAERRSAGRSRSLFSKLASLPPAQRRSTLIHWVIGIGLAFIIGLGVVTAVEASVGKNLSCWLWNKCPTAASSSEGEASNTTTLPSILGGGQITNSSTAAQVGPSAPLQQPPAPPSAPGAPTQSSSGSGQPSSSLSSQQQNRPEQYQQQSGQPSSSSSSQQQSPSGKYGQQSQYEQPNEEYQQQSPSSGSGHQQRSPSSGSEHQQQSKDIQPTDKPGGQHQQAQQE
jgi:hypothetical protein